MSTFSALAIDGVAALGATGLMLVFVAPPGGVSQPAVAPPPRAVILTAQTQPLPVQLFNEQIAFNVGLAVNFVSTGVTLAQRIAQLPGMLVSDVRNGTPLPTATAEALTAFAAIEFQAGRDLLGYGQDIVNFQIQFLSRVLSALTPFASGSARSVVAAGSTQVISPVQLTHRVLHTPTATTQSTAPSTKKVVVQHHSTVATSTDTAPSPHRSGTSEGTTDPSHHVHRVDAVHLHRTPHAKGTRAHRH